MFGHKKSHNHDHPHGSTGSREKHDHTHGAVDPSILTTERGIWAVKWSFFWLFVTALFRAIIVLFTGSIALLADTFHNIGDAATAIPLWIAFKLAQKKPTDSLTATAAWKDLAGVMIVLIILFSAAVAAYGSIHRFLHPQTVAHLSWLIVAAVIGYLGNVAVARFRVRIGNEIGSAALIADGHHARVDALTSLVVLFGAIGVWLGYPVADPIVGLCITVAILRIVWETCKSIFTRLLDGVDPEVVDEINHAVKHVQGVGREPSLHQQS